VENVKRFNSFAEFYPYYLSEHALIALPIAGYSFAWIGHFFFEKNRPATFQHPFYSLLGDFVMYRDMILGKVPF